jgi:putative SOS response-associated peptidase YedK
MPAVIQPQDFESWLTGEVKEANALLRPAAEDFFVAEKTVIPRGGPPPAPPPPAQMSLL